MLHSIVWTKRKNSIEIFIQATFSFQLSNSITQNTIIRCKRSSNDHHSIIIDNNSFHNTVSTICSTITYKSRLKRTFIYSIIIGTGNLCQTILYEELFCTSIWIYSIKPSKSTSNEDAVIRRVSAWNKSYSINDIICSISCCCTNEGRVQNTQSRCCITVKF